MENFRTLFDLTGKVALICGGGTGIGRQCAEVLSAYGATVILAARREDKLRDAADAIQKAGGRAFAVSMDITDAASVEAALDRVADAGTISILVNSAGVVAKPSLLNLTEEDWNRVINTNLKGAWVVSRAVVQRMVDQGLSGNIIHIASILGFAAQKGTGAYMASKAGLLHLTKSMALEWSRYGIRVNAVAPGYFGTDLAEEFLKTPAGEAMIKRIPMRRLGQLKDLAGPVLLLASDAGAYMTGSTIIVDGGHSIPQA